MLYVVSERMKCARFCFAIIRTVRVVYSVTWHMKNCYQYLFCDNTDSSCHLLCDMAYEKLLSILVYAIIQTVRVIYFVTVTGTLYESPPSLDTVILVSPGETGIMVPSSSIAHTDVSSEKKLMPYMDSSFMLSSHWL